MPKFLIELPEGVASKKDCKEYIKQALLSEAGHHNPGDVMHDIGTAVRARMKLYPLTEKQSDRVSDLFHEMKVFGE